MDDIELGVLIPIGQARLATRESRREQLEQIIKQKGYL
jgi:hypothetical protein